jgi:hypothetical protein
MSTKERKEVAVLRLLTEGEEDNVFDEEDDEDDDEDGEELGSSKPPVVNLYVIIRNKK